MIKHYEIKHLSNKFMQKYPDNIYPEFENKLNRPYVVFIIKIDNHTFALPFRTNMNHKYGYKFKATGRVTNYSTGLDFTKAVLVDDASLLGDPAIIDNKEYLELSKKHFFIRKQFIKYFENYKRYLKNELASIIGKSEKTVQRCLNSLIEKKYISRIGTNQYGYLEVLK